ncbi:MAG: hypothetical protein WA584_07435 [Pyrinomonadaceae bacterium]
MNERKNYNLTSEDIAILEVLSEGNVMSASEIVKLSEGKLNETETRFSLPSFIDQNLVVLHKNLHPSIEKLEIHKYSLSELGRQILINFKKTEAQRVDSKEKKSFMESEVIEIKEHVGSILSHTIVIIFALLSIYLVHIILDRLLGKDAVILDLVKVKYIIDAGDLIVLLSWLFVVILNSYKIVWKTLKKN